MRALVLDETGKECRHRQAIHIAGVNPGEQRLREILRRLGAEAPRHEPADRFVAPVAFWRHEELGSHAQLAGPRKEARAEERPDAPGNAEHRAARPPGEQSPALAI